MADTTLSESLTVDIGANLAPLTDKLGQAARDVTGFATGTVGSANRTMSTAFTGTFTGLQAAIARAARTGAISMREMVDSILADIERLAIRRAIVAPFESLISSAVASVVGATPGRAAGGPVSPGTPYVVGERGPELFVPAGNGAIVSNPRGQGGANITVNIQTADAKSFLKSESQVAAMLTRALARGQRNL